MPLAPCEELVDILATGLDRGPAASYAIELLRPLPTYIASPQGHAWKAALVGRGQSRSGYRDAVVLSGGRLYRASLRQRHRGGSLSIDPVAEIGRAFDVASSGKVHPLRARAPLVPATEIDFD
jgi:hypothetical protein